MNILFVADFHGVGFVELEQALSSLSASVDIVCTLGDIHVNLLKILKEHFIGIPIIGVAGNHDTSYFLEAAEVFNLHRTPFFHKDTNFIGIEGSYRYSGKNRPMYTQEEVNEFVDLFPSDVPIDILICHNSPLGIHDRADNAHVGFEGITRFIETKQPSFVFHGHQHKNITSVHQNTTVVGVYGGIVFDTLTASVVEQLALDGCIEACVSDKALTEAIGTESIASTNNQKPTFLERLLNFYKHI